MTTPHVLCVGPLVDDAFGLTLASRPDVVLELLPDDADEGALGAALARAHVWQITSNRFSIPPALFARAPLLARAPRLLAVSASGAGFDTIDVEACTAAGLLAVNQAGGNAEAVAEHALGMMLCLSKRIVETDHLMRRRAGLSNREYGGRDLRGKTLGIVGFGAIGRRLAELVAPLRMRVLACDPYLAGDVIAAHGATKASLGEVLASSDVVSLHCPLTAETRGLFGAREFAAMRPHAYFVTTARGGVHDEAALAAALREGRIAGAGLDVWDLEPPPPDHPLLAFDNVLASPHTAGTSREAYRELATIAAEQLMAILDGARPPRLLNPEVWEAYRLRRARILGA